MFRLLLAAGVMTLALTGLAKSLPLPGSEQPAAAPSPEPLSADRVPDAPTKIGPYAFYVYLEMSPAAARLLAAKKEKVVVMVSYRGNPTNAGKRFADPGSGMIETDTEVVTVPATTKQVTVRGSKVTAADVKRILDEAVLVNVNVSTARLSGPDNLLNCKLYEDALAYARESGVNIACKLISE